MEPIFFLYEEKLKKFHSLVSGMICGGAGELAFSETEAVADPQCQFRVVDGDVYVLDLGDAGLTRMGGEPLRWGEARKLALNDTLEISGRILILTNRSVFGPGRTQERTRVTQVVDEAPDDTTVTMTRTQTRNRGSAALSEAPSPMIDHLSFYQAMWNQAREPSLREEKLQDPGFSRRSAPVPSASGLRLVSSVSLSAADPWERPRVLLKLLLPLVLMALLGAGLLIWKALHH